MFVRILLRMRVYWTEEQIRYNQKVLKEEASVSSDDRVRDGLHADIEVDLNILQEERKNLRAQLDENKTKIWCSPWPRHRLANEMSSHPSGLPPMCQRRSLKCAHIAGIQWILKIEIEISTRCCGPGRL